MQLSAAQAAAATATTSRVKATAGRAVDGDYKVRSAATSQTKDADGDYKPAAKTPAMTSSSAVQAALADLTKGG